MNKLTRIALVSAAILAALAGVLVLVLWAAPPDLLRIGANYAAKVVCSNVFIAGRDPDEVLRDDVQAPGASLLRVMRVTVERHPVERDPLGRDPLAREQGVVRAGLFGFIGGGLAVSRPGLGCAVAPEGNLAEVVSVEPRPRPRLARRARSAPTRRAAWPDGESVHTDPALDRLIADDALTGPATRAVLVVHRGAIVAERYGPGFDARTPQLGWSMAKSVTAGLIGALVNQGRLALDRQGLWPVGGGREAVKVSDLMAMSSGLRWNEAYGPVTDVTRMLFLAPDMAAFARSRPLEHPPGAVWNYSSGSAVILARIAQDAGGLSAARLARELLFEPLGMRSAVMEADAYGTLVGSSYMYATPRDWARYGQFLLQKGVWHGRPILAPGFVSMMTAPVPASRGQYGQGLVWLWGPDAAAPGRNPDAAFGIPADAFWLEGHDGQSIAVDSVARTRGGAPRAHALAAALRAAAPGAGGAERAALRGRVRARRPAP